MMYYINISFVSVIHINYLFINHSDKAFYIIVFIK